MWGKEKLSKSLSTGVVALVFILLIVQFVFFAFQVARNYFTSPAVAELNTETGSGKNVSGNNASGRRRSGSAVASAGRATSSGTTAKRASSGVSGRATSSAAGASEKASARAASGAAGRATMGTADVSGRTSTGRATTGGATPGKGTAASSAGGSARRAATKPPPKTPLNREKVVPWWEAPIELNGADSIALISLKGIGGYYAKMILEYREKLGGSYASVVQLMDIRGIDSARFAGFAERVFIDTSLIRRIDLYTLPYDSLATHPYIGPYAAKGIERMRKVVPKEQFSIDELVKNNVLPKINGERLKLYQKR